ncbi:alpha/beta fold hydrolase [Oceanomicrobium pacificus]|uniref:Alpha/beta fold hydrolase n=1 Tax=Oceanomicrobium pacificus TaxID=2692916 RepID=A0A6B0TNQ7_9RHOB|nr:alpha/beta hydrolase [Oceanomicrobium pacificus]MXU66187.1 alpha/beta fold hydrolase [Oceanomicrobium pacificus]
MSSTGSGPRIDARRVSRRRLLQGAGGLSLAALAGCAPEDGVKDQIVNYPPTGDFITRDGTRLHYEMAGQGRAVILIHGASGNLRDWTYRPYAEIARTRRVLAFDRPGLGFSSRPATRGDDPSEQARLMREAARGLGIEKAIIVGHSYGGAVALAWALDAPESVDGLVLLGAASHPWEGGVGFLYGLAGSPVTGPAVARALGSFATESFVERTVARIFAPQPVPVGYIDHVGPPIALQPDTIRANAADVGNLKGYLRTMAPRYATLRMPVEILHGTADTTVPLKVHSEPLAKAVDGSNLVRLDGVGHMPHHVATPALLAAIDRVAQGTA